jgi:hypothetical protein
VKQEELVESLKEINRLAAACLAALDDPKATNRKAAQKPKPASARRSTAPAPDFTTQIRHFMNTYAKGMNGQQRFALMVAYLSKGKTDTKVVLQAIKEAWSKMTKLLGKFNTGYAVWAKDNGWVDSPEPKVYVLMSGWKEILIPDA